jgi:hypothetical protein
MDAKKIFSSHGRFYVVPRNTDTIGDRIDIMLDEVGSSNDCEQDLSADEHQPLLQKDNLPVQRGSVGGLARHHPPADGRLGKDLPAPLPCTSSLQGEERSRSYAWKICATSISFFVIGMNNSASGVCGSTLQSLRLGSRGLLLLHS